jgi:hypothetical protein
MPYGTLSTFDTLATLRAASGNVAEIGEDVAFQSISMALATHNQLLSEAIADFVDDTSDRLRRYGGPDQMSMEELDEYGTARTQKIAAGTTLGFPLKFYGGALQWTRLYFQNATGAELAAQVDALMDADVKNTLKQLKWTLLNPVNSTFEDRRVDHVQLPLKGLVNADGAAIPIAPDGTVFNANTHTHYFGTAAFVASDLTSVINTVVEHFLSGKILVLINQGSEATVRGFTGFYPYFDSRLTPSINNTNATNANLDVTNLTNRAIGIFGPGEVWVKPWIPAGYVIAIQVGSTQKALVMRTRNAGSGDLQLLFDIEEHPLRAREYGREFGFGVWNRVAAAVLDTAHASYTAPALASL